MIPVAWRQGDFSSLAKQLYNPFTQVTTTAADGTVTYVRQPFPGQSDSPVADQSGRAQPVQLSDFYPTPLTNANVNNWNGAGRQRSPNNDQGDVKIDYRISDKDSLSGRFSMGAAELLLRWTPCA